MCEAILLKLHKIKKKLYRIYKETKKRKRFKRYLQNPGREKVYILGSPTYTNLGDSAIFMAEKNLIQKAGFKEEQIKEVTFDEYYAKRKDLRKWIRNKYLICGLGGGNMGNQWPIEEQFRYDMLEDFPENSIVVFPQTIHYIDNRNEEKDKERSVKYYEGHNNLVLIAREEKSYEIMNKMYPNTTILLTPDIVLSATMEDFGIKSKERQGALLCIRNDAEKSVSNGVWQAIEEELNKRDILCEKMDMYSGNPITKENRAENVRAKMQEFANAKIVITDRLHGMVFAALTGTPCIVFSNYNHKVKGTYDWISYLPYIKYVTSLEEAKKHIPELLKMENTYYDNKPLELYFDKIAEVIKNGIN